MKNRQWVGVIMAMAAGTASLYGALPGYAAAHRKTLAADSTHFSYDSGNELVENKKGLYISLPASMSGKTIESYQVKAVLGAEDSMTSYINPEYWSSALAGGRSLQSTTLNQVNINLTGKAMEKVRPVEFYGVQDLTMNDVVINTDLENAFDDRHLEVTNMRFADSQATIHNLYLNSRVDFKNADEAAHNGVYSMVELGQSSVVNITGNVFINTNLSSLQEAYDGSYGIGVSKNDALSGKYGGVINVNANADGSIIDPNATIQLFGNIDVKGGTVRVAMSGENSVWYGAEVGGIVEDPETNWYQPRENSRLMLSLANGAQWVPDIMQEDDPAFGDASSRNSYIGEVTLEPGGIINMHGLNRHTNADETVSHLYIHNLTSRDGILRIDANGSPVDSRYRNSSDFVVIAHGQGNVYVQPIDGSKLQGVTADNPVRIGDVASGVTLTGLSSNHQLVEGTLYDYTPILEKNVVGTKFGTLADNDWYIVGVQKTPNEATETIKGAASLLYGDMASHRSLDTLNQRLGELRDYADAEDGVWVRWKTGRTESGTYGKYQYDWDFYQLGYDRKFAARRGNWYIGGAYHTTHGDASYEFGGGELKSYGGSLYASWAGKGGEYADYVLQYAHYRNKFHIVSGTDTVSGAYSDGAYTASVEYGKKFPLAGEWFIEPQAQLTYSNLEDVDYTLSNGIKAHQDGMDSLIGRAGFRIGRIFQDPRQKEPNQLYFKLNLLHEFMGDKDVSLVGTDSATFNGTVASRDTWFTAGLGGKVTLSKAAALYGDIEKSFGGDITTKWQFNLGLRWMF